MRKKFIIFALAILSMITTLFFSGNFVYAAMYDEEYRGQYYFSTSSD